MCQSLFPNLLYLQYKLRGYILDIAQVEAAVHAQLQLISEERRGMAAENLVARAVVKNQLREAQAAYKKMQALERSSAAEADEFLSSISHSLRRLKLDEPREGADASLMHESRKRKHRPQVLSIQDDANELGDCLSSPIHAPPAKRVQFAFAGKDAPDAGEEGSDNAEEYDEAPADDFYAGFSVSEPAPTGKLSRAERTMRAAFAPANPADNADSFLQLLNGSSSESSEVTDAHKGASTVDKPKQMPAEVTRTLLRWLVSHAHHPYPTNGKSTHVYGVSKYQEQSRNMNG